MEGLLQFLKPVLFVVHIASVTYLHSSMFVIVLCVVCYNFLLGIYSNVCNSEPSDSQLQHCNVLMLVPL